MAKTAAFFGNPKKMISIYTLRKTVGGGSFLLSQKKNESLRNR